MNDVIAIVGPTASGKSSTADIVAGALCSEVISVDAMQIYRGMDIGTAKVPEEDRVVPLRMVDVCDVDDTWSAEVFRNEARGVIDTLHAQNKIPVLCGGTGLYLNATIDDMDFPKGNTTSTTRVYYTQFAKENGNEATWNILNEKDPDSAALIHPNNVRRVIRALEMYEEGGSYAHQNKNLYKRKPYYNSSIYGLMWPREQLYERINLRVDIMMEQGLLEEVQGLLDLGLLDSLTSKQAIGCKEILGYTKGEYDLDEAIELIKRNTRRYAKRQMTWFKKDERIKWFDMSSTTCDEAAQIILDQIN